MDEKQSSSSRMMDAPIMEMVKQMKSSSHSRQVAGLNGQAVTVVGLGRSGIAAVRLLQAAGARVAIADHQAERILREHLDQAVITDVQLFAGPAFDQAFEAVELVVLSPGVSSTLPVLASVRSRGIPVVGEIELASWFFSQPLVAVTGTNGKSTTVSLTARMLEESGRHVFFGGNLGIPLSDAALALYQQREDSTARSSAFDCIVAEVSSFQLETIEQFHPFIAVLLNISPDHLDRYPSMVEYERAKWRIFQNQTSADWAVVNADDPAVDTWKSRTAARVVEFSLRGPVPYGVYLEGGRLVSNMRNGSPEDILSTRDGHLQGDHNIANLLAAMAVGLLCGCPVDALRRAVGSFSGLDHAMEVVREWRGVLFINDSKGTNIDATLKAVESIHRPMFLILGGKDKGGDFRRLRNVLETRVKRVLVMGEAAPLILQALAGFEGVSPVKNMATALELAVRESQSGDVVMLSPACASFDEFRDYRERGQCFRDLVNALS